MMDEEKLIEWLISLPSLHRKPHSIFINRKFEKLFDPLIGYQSPNSSSETFG